MTLLDFLPLFEETVAAIRARLDADVNAGRDPDDDSYVDTTEGGFYFDLTQAVVLELERVWDSLSIEVPASAFVTTAWGEYLDEHGAVVGEERHDATQATGTVTFTGTDGTIIPTGWPVATEQVDVDQEPVEFTTTQEVIIAGGAVDADIIAEETGSEGNVAAGTILVLVDSIDGVTGVSNAEATGGGTDIETDELYRERLLLEYASSLGGGTVIDYERWSLDYPGVGKVTVVPLWSGPGTVRVIVTDPDNQPVSTEVVDGLQADLDPFSATTQLDGGVTFPQSDIDVDSTEGFTPSGYFYVENQRITYTSIGSATQFSGCTGTGSLTDNAVITQRGGGAGRAPIGAEVTVDTPALVTVDVDADVDLLAGYSLDGAAATSAVRESIERQLANYINELGAGADVLLNRTESRFFLVQGVYDIANVELNAVAGDFAVNSLQVATLGTVTLAEV